MGTASRNIQVASMGGARILYGGVILTSGQLDVDKWPKNLYDVDGLGGHCPVSTVWTPLDQPMVTSWVSPS